MQPTDVGAITNYLQALYSERFAPLTSEMAVVWMDTLRPFPYDLARQAVKRWAMEHLPQHAPTLHQLAFLIEDMQLEQRRQQAALLREQTAVLREAERYAQPQRDDDLCVQEVRDLVRTIWPDLYAVPEERTPEEQAARREQLRRQARELRRMAAEEGL